MSEKKSFNRWMVVFAAILIQMNLGAIYAWSVFTLPLTEAGWSVENTQDIFATALAFFAIATVLSGRLMPKLGPRFVVMMGGVFLGFGYILAGYFGETDFTKLLFFIGFLAGSGIGLSYVVPIAVGMRWFPDKKGLITGLAVAGFGFGATLWIKLAGSWGMLIETYGISNTFIFYGFLFLISVLLGSIWMVFPPKDWQPEGWQGGEQSLAQKETAFAEWTSREMLGTSQFYKLFFAFIFASSAGLMTIGLMKLFPMLALIENGVNTVQASAIAGTAMAVFFSLSNGFGRIAWGAISDFLGVKCSMLLMLCVQGCVVIAFQKMACVSWFLYVGASLIGFNFGGNFALFPTMTSAIFGAKNVGQNYGWVFLAYGLGGIFGPKLGGMLGDLNHFPLAFTICGILCFVAAGLIKTIQAPLKD